MAATYAPIVIISSRGVRIADVLQDDRSRLPRARIADAAGVPHVYTRHGQPGDLYPIYEEES